MTRLKLTQIIRHWLIDKQGFHPEKIHVLTSKFVRTAVDGRADSIHVESYGTIRIYSGKKSNQAPWNKSVTVYRAGSEMPLYINPSEPDFFKQITDYLEL